MNRLAALLALTVSLVPAVASAGCDYEDHAAHNHRVVPEYSYSHVVRLPEGPFPSCEAEAEGAKCDGLTGYGCALEMQRIYTDCVSEEVCLEAVDGWLEDDLVSGEPLSRMYDACRQLVVASGGSL